MKIISAGILAVQYMGENAPPRDQSIHRENQDNQEVQPSPEQEKISRLTPVQLYAMSRVLERFIGPSLNHLSELTQKAKDSPIIQNHDIAMHAVEMLGDTAERTNAKIVEMRSSNATIQQQSGTEAPELELSPVSDPPKETDIPEEVIIQDDEGIHMSTVRPALLHVIGNITSPLEYSIFVQNFMPELFSTTQKVRDTLREKFIPVFLSNKIILKRVPDENTGHPEWDIQADNESTATTDTKKEFLPKVMDMSQDQAHALGRWLNQKVDPQLNEIREQTRTLVKNDRRPEAIVIVNITNKLKDIITGCQTASRVTLTSPVDTTEATMFVFERYNSPKDQNATPLSGEIRIDGHLFTLTTEALEAVMKEMKQATQRVENITEGPCVEAAENIQDQSEQTVQTIGVLLQDPTGVTFQIEENDVSIKDAKDMPANASQEPQTTP